MAQPTQDRLAAQLEKPERTSGNVGEAGSGTQSEHGPNFQDHEDEHVHHVSMTTYYVVFTFLIVMLLITVGAWYFDQHISPLGRLSTPVAMAIAVAKAVAIVLFFMHVKFSSKLVQIFACTGVAFVAVMFTLTLQDYLTRDWLPRPGVYAAAPSPHVRASSVGAAPNSQSTPSDNMAPMGTAPAAMSTATYGSTTSTLGSAASTSTVRGADITIGAGTTPMSDAAEPGREAGTVGPTSGVIGQRDDARPGAILGGAANNSFGSAVQSQGIEPKPAMKAPISARVSGAGTTAPGARVQPVAPTVAAR